jgi:ferritin
MASVKMLEALNGQLNKEMFSSYLYLSMAVYFEDKNLNGMASWMKMQSQEEYEHGMKFYEYIMQVGGKVKLLQIDEPEENWDSALAVFEAALEHEKYITKSIHELVDIANEEKDHATFNFLSWFVAEQVEEEATADEIIESFKLIGDNKSGMYMLDRELGARQPDAE